MSSEQQKWTLVYWETGGKHRWHIEEQSTRRVILDDIHFSDADQAQESLKRVIAATNAALADEHQAGWHEGRRYEVEFGAKPQRSEQQEWKAVGDLVVDQNDHYISTATSTMAAKLFANIHNAELATERANATEARKGWTREVHRADDAEHAVGENCRTIARLEQELATERQRREQLEGALQHPDDPNHTCLFKTQLLSAQAAIEKHNKIQNQFVEAMGHVKNHNWLRCSKITVDLSALHRHDDEVRKPLVEALQVISDQVPHFDAVIIVKGRDIWLHDFIAAALARVKEEKDG